MMAEINNICTKCGFNCGLIIPIYLWGKLQMYCYHCFRKEMRINE